MTYNTAPNRSVRFTNDLFSWAPIFVDWTKITYLWGSKFVAKVFSFLIHIENHKVVTWNSWIGPSTKTTTICTIRNYAIHSIVLTFLSFIKKSSNHFKIIDVTRSQTFGKFFKSSSERLSKFRTMPFQEHVSKGIALLHPVFYGDIICKLRRVKGTANFISVGSKIIIRLRTSDHRQSNIGSSTTMYRSRPFLKQYLHIQCFLLLWTSETFWHPIFHGTVAVTYEPAAPAAVLNTALLCNKNGYFIAKTGQLIFIQKYRYKDWILLVCFSWCYERQRIHVNLHVDPLSFLPQWETNR